MINKPESSNKKRKGVTAGVVICFIAAIAALGTHTVRNYQNRVAEDEVVSGEQETEDTQSQETDGDTTKLNFTAEDKLLWPVSGDIIMNYSVDQTVYFISGAVNDQVLSSSAGLVKSIDLTAETGTTVTIDMGNGYEAIYGQLKEVAVNSGDYVEAKTVLGYIGEPTKYYSVEGSNLYFEVRKDGVPVNPMDFLE